MSGGLRNNPGRVPVRAVLGFGPLALLILAQLSAASDRFLITLVTTPVKQDLALSDAQLGLLHGSAFVVFYALAMPLFGSLADRGHQRRILLASIGLWTLATLGFGLAGSFAVLCLSRLALGLGQAGLAPASLSLIAHGSGPGRMARNVSLFTVGGSFGQSFALLAGGAVLAWLVLRGGLAFPGIGPLAPWRALFVLACLPNLALILGSAALRLPRPPPAARPGLRAAWTWILRRRRSYLPHCAAAACAVLMGRTLAAWGPTLYVRSHGMSPAESGVVLGGLLLIGGPIGHLSAGLILDRVARRHRRAAASRMLGLGLLAALPVAILMALAPDRTLSLAAFTLLTAVIGFTAPPAVTGVQLLTPVSLRGRVSALFIAAVTLTASGTGPPLLGLLADTVFGADHLGRALIVLYALVGVPGMLLAFRAARSSGPRGDASRSPVGGNVSAGRPSCHG
jgi:MFS family permease